MTLLAEIIIRDTTVNRPAAGIEGRLFYDITLSKLQRDNGAAWEDVSESTHDAVTLDGDAGTILDLSTQEIGLDVQTANTVLAGPTTGAANEPTFRALVAADVGTGAPTGAKYLKDDMSWDSPASSGNIPESGWVAASGTWTPRSQAFTNDPAAGTNIELEMADTSGFAVGDVVNVSSSAGSENALITVVHANVHLTVAALYYNHDLTTPLVRFASTLYVERAYTNDPAAGNNIELNMASTAGFAVGDLVEVSSSAGRENATVTVVHVDTHLTVNTLALNHTTTSPMVKQVIQNTFIVDTSVDLSASIGVGHKIKITDTTVKYFFVHAIATTRLTLYGGTDYSIVKTTALASPYYSMVKAPFEFPLDPIKWTWEVADTGSRSQASPAQNTWYNPTSLAISLPIGCWRTLYETVAQASDSSSADWTINVTLSTANNSESDIRFTSGIRNAAVTYVYSSVHKEKSIKLAARTTYYLNFRTNQANQDTLAFRGDISTTIISAVCAYL